jgi:co-chaperonin GroES (HSP10)
MGDFVRSVNPVPINGHVLVRLKPTGDFKTTGGIIVPEQVTTKPIVGKVEELSRGYVEAGIFRRHELQIGDVIIFNWKAGIDLDLDDVSYRIIHESDTIAILKGVEELEDV